MKVCVLVLGLALAGCSALPRDVEGTTEQVAKTGTIRVGLGATAIRPSETGKLIAALEQATGARAKAATGETEPLLAALEQGKLDLVFAWFDKETPWATRVALAPPLAARGGDKDRLELRAAARNGENRWVMLVETKSRAIAPEAAQ